MYIGVESFSAFPLRFSSCTDDFLGCAEDEKLISFRRKIKKLSVLIDINVTSHILAGTCWPPSGGNCNIILRGEIMN